MLALDEGVQDIVLVGEVRVERPAGEAGTLTDLLDGRADHPTLGEHGASGIEDPLASRLAPRGTGRVGRRRAKDRWRRSARRPVVGTVLIVHRLLGPSIQRSYSIH